MEGHKKYLAGRLFTEGDMVTYRTLSRALKVHVSTAKAMLYGFHQWQNSSSDHKAHATYIIYGTKKPVAQADGDIDMTSSAPEPERWGEEVQTRTVTLVTEERLKDVLEEYSSVTSFQMYSLAPHPVKDLQLLSEVSREAYQEAGVDHAEQSKLYGTIVNGNMKKRSRQGKRPAPAPAPAPVEKKPAFGKPASTATTSGETVKAKEESKPAVKAESAAPAETPASSTSSKKMAAPKKGGIMSAFSKAASKPKSKPGSNVSTPKTENQSPALSDDGEDDDEDILPVPKKAADGTARRSRQDREADLRRMMDEESDGEDEQPSEKEPEDEPMEEAPEPEPETKTEPEASQEPAEVVSSTGGGRRRGRKQVMKKKQVMDDQGYLVTIQEKGWESFSEDEPTPASSKPKSVPTSSAGSQGAKKKAGPKGQGNIMSFFAKK